MLESATISGRATAGRRSKGSRFEAYLPIWDQPIDALAIQPAPDAARGERVLVVDDESYLVELVGHILRDRSYEPVGVDTSAEALARLSAEPRLLGRLDGSDHAAHVRPGLRQIRA